MRKSSMLLSVAATGILCSASYAAEISGMVKDASGKAMEVRATPLRTVYLAAGSGYIPQPDWAHGMYQGPLKIEGKTYDVSTAEARAALGPLYETLCRFELSTGEVSYGLLENLVVGTYHPHGFVSPGAVAP